MTWVNPEDVIGRWTGTDDIPVADDPLLLNLIGDAEVLILRTFPNIQQRIDGNTLDIRIIKIVVAGMVQRAYQTTADGKSQFSYTNGPFSESGSYSDGRRGLYFTDEDLKNLSPQETNKAFSINLDIHKANFQIGGLDGGVYGPNVWIPNSVVVWEQPYGD